MAADYDNVRAAMSFAFDHAPPLAMRVLGGITFFFTLRGGFAEGRAWVEAAPAHADGQPRELVGRVQECGAVIAYFTGDVPGLTRHAEAAYAAFASVGDEHGMANALRELGRAAGARGDVSRADAFNTELAELAERIGDRWNAAIALNNLGFNAFESGDWQRVVELCGRSGILRRDLGDEWGMALALINVAEAEFLLGRLSSAAATLRIALEASIKVDARLVVAGCLGTGASIALALGNSSDAALLVGATERLDDELGASGRYGVEEEIFARTAASLRTSLGADAYADTVRRGRELTLEEAVACALAATGGLD